MIKYWRPKPTSASNPYSVAYSIPDLLPLISSRTRIVAFSACSNILGSIFPVEEIVKSVRSRALTEGAANVEVSVDSVAYAPHRQIDVRKWDVDYCIFSFYKVLSLFLRYVLEKALTRQRQQVYGPHASALYMRTASLHALSSLLVHHFLKVDKSAYKLQPGGPGYEIVYATTAVLPYLLSLSTGPSGPGSLQASFALIAEHEQTLIEPLLAFLTAPEQTERGVRVVGDTKVGLDRVPTISFVVTGQRPLKSKDVVGAFDAKGGVRGFFSTPSIYAGVDQNVQIGIRYGHFYAYTLVDNLSPKLDVDDGVVRISLVHYNTVDEVRRIIDILKEVLQ